MTSEIMTRLGNKNIGFGNLNEHDIFKLTVKKIFNRP